MTFSLTTLWLIFSLFVLAWTILFILLPFFVFKIRNQLIETNHKIDKLIEIANKAVAVLDQTTKNYPRDHPANIRLKKDPMKSQSEETQEEIEKGVVCTNCLQPFHPDAGTDPDNPLCMRCMLKTVKKKS